MKAEMSGEPEKLVGKYFHSANETNQIEWQGVVIGEPHPGWYLVQLFEWASGDPSVQRLVPIEKMISWVFYPDADAMTGSKLHNIKSQKLGKQHEGVEPVFLQKDQAIGYAETRACAKSRRRDARGAIDLSRLLGSELRWHARIDSCC